MALMESSLEKHETSGTPFWRYGFGHGITPATVREHQYPGSGSENDPFIVSWIIDDEGDPQHFSRSKKWGITALIALATLSCSFASSAFSSVIQDITDEFHASTTVGTLGISLFVLGFAVGPLFWAPLSELHGRRIVFSLTLPVFTIFNAATAGAQNIETILILRFLAGSFGSSPLANGGGVLADLFSADERSLAMSLYAAAPFLGPALGPIIGGFLGEAGGWRWVEGIMAIFAGIAWLLLTLLVPETYAPVLLRNRAARLSQVTGNVYRASTNDGKTASLATILRTTLTRPWIFLFGERIVFLLSVYMAIIYGILYMLFSAFPIVYRENRGWGKGISGLSFTGVVLGTLAAVLYSILDNKRYVKLAVEAAATNRKPTPEARLPPAMVGSLALPVGLFWFAWTNSPSIHWIVSIAAGAPFGFGMCLVFLAIMNYLVDTYTIHAASVLAANSVLRSVFGAAFPIFAGSMYGRLGIHWASSIPAFLALACTPLPFLFYRYGYQIRCRSRFAAAKGSVSRNNDEEKIIN